MKKFLLLLLYLILSSNLIALEVPFCDRFIYTESEDVFGLVFNDDGSTLVLSYFNQDNKLETSEYKVTDTYYQDFNATVRLTIVASCMTDDCKYGDIKLIGRVGGPSVTRGRYAPLKRLTLENESGSYNLQGYGDSKKVVLFGMLSKTKWNIIGHNFFY